MNVAGSDKQYIKNAARPVEDNIAVRINWLARQFERYERYWEKDLERNLRNARMYWHVDFGQWPQIVVDKLREQGRRPPTFPIISDKIESLVGSFLANGFDMKFEPMNGKIDTLTLKAQDMFYADKYNMDWDSPEIEALLNSFIMVGYERMAISDMVDEFGNITWETINPRHTMLDPAWKTNKIGDLQNYFVYDWKTPAEIKRIYPKSSPHLDVLYEKEMREGIDYGDNYGAVPRYRVLGEKWGDTHKVIEFHYVKNTEETYEYDKVNNCWFPDTGFKNGSDEDRQAKIQYISEMELQPLDIVNLKRKKTVKYIEAIVPSIDNWFFLDRGKDIIQTQNVNLYPLGIRYNGQYQGVVDRLYDLQMYINKGEMNIQDIQQRTAKGAFIMDRLLSGGDVALEKQIEANWNKPGARMWADEGSLASGKKLIQELPTTPPTADTFRQIDRYYDYADRFSKVSAAQDARTESTKESGKLFKYKVEVGLVQQKYIMKFYEAHKRDKMEAWLRQAKITYAGVPRTFGTADGKETFTVNQEVTNILTGETMVLDDISRLPRMKIIIVPSPQGINVRTEIQNDMLKYMEILKDPADRLLRIIFMREAIMTGEMKDETKEEIRIAADKLIEEAALIVAGNIQEAELRLMNAEKMKAQVQKMSGRGQAQQEAPPPQQMTRGAPTQKQITEGTPKQNSILQQKEV